LRENEAENMTLIEKDYRCNFGQSCILGIDDFTEEFKTSQLPIEKQLEIMVEMNNKKHMEVRDFKLRLSRMESMFSMMQNQIDEQAKLIVSLQTKKIEEQLNLEAEVDLLLSDDVIGEQLSCEAEEKDEIEEDKPEDEAEEDEKPKYTIKEYTIQNSCKCMMETQYTFADFDDETLGEDGEREHDYKIGYVLRKAKSAKLKCECWYISMTCEYGKRKDCYRVKAFTKDIYSIPTEGWEFCGLDEECECECCEDRLDNKSPIVTRKQDKPEANELDR
jgi:hypothetical protein